MAQQAYAFHSEAAGVGLSPNSLALTVSLFGDATALKTMTADVSGAGLAIRSSRALDSLLDNSAGALGDIVIADCRLATGAALAALVRLDERAARAGAEVLLLTTAAALDDVFGCMATARTQFLVDSGQAERVVALGLALGRLPGSRVRELDEEERLALLRLTEEVARLATKLDTMALPLAGGGKDDMTSRLAAPGIGYRGAREGEGTKRRQRPPLPDARLIHQIVRQRRLRARYFDDDLFADPAWDILLDLAAARAEHRRVSVTSLCIAAAVPTTTALRWIAQMTDAGLLVREQDEVDRRRAFIGLSDQAADALARYFDELGREAAKLI